MANLLRTTTGLKITWRQSTNKDGTERLNLILHGPNQVIGKASVTANQLAGYIVKNNKTKNNGD